MRQMILVCLVLLAGLGTTGFGPPVLTGGSPTAMRFYPEQISALNRLQHPPVVDAQAALVVDLDAGQTLYVHRADVPLPPASTVKIMTALVTLQRSDLEAQVTISAQAAATSGSRMGLQAGETLTVRQLLYGLLLPSGNDAAVALAEHVAGGEDQFVALMNETAATMGLTGTHFASPHGLDDPSQTITAEALVRLVQAALVYPDFAAIVATDSTEIAGHSLVNTNQLLGSYPGADGIKTGTTDAAGECLVASVQRQGHRLVAVILGSGDRYTAARTLLDFAAAGWSWQSLGLPDDALAWLPGQDGRTYKMRALEQRELFLPAWQWAMAQPVRVIEGAPADPALAAASVGRVSWMLDGQVMATVPLTVWTRP